MENKKRFWSQGLTPEVSTSNVIQKALNWWSKLPIQDIYDNLGWANLCMKYFPTKTDCYHFTEDEVLYMCEQEHLNVK